LTLHGEHDRVTFRQRQLRRMLDDRNSQRAPALGCPEPQSVRRDSRAVGSAGDQDDVAAGFEKARAERSAHRSGAVKDVSHANVVGGV
jgi:hypothetical protein